MGKVTFMGAGSTVFVRNIIGDSMCCELLHDALIEERGNVLPRYR